MISGHSEDTSMTETLDGQYGTVTEEAKPAPAEVSCCSKAGKFSKKFGFFTRVGFKWLRRGPGRDCQPDSPVLSAKCREPRNSCNSVGAEGCESPWILARNRNSTTAMSSSNFLLIHHFQVES